jgi:Bacterial Ig-like domain
MSATLSSGTGLLADGTSEFTTTSPWSSACGATWGTPHTYRPFGVVAGSFSVGPQGKVVVGSRSQAIQSFEFAPREALPPSVLFSLFNPLANEPIKLRFTTPLDPATVNLQTVSLTDATATPGLERISLTTSLTDGNRTLLLTPAQPLKPNSPYDLRVGAFMDANKLTGAPISIRMSPFIPKPAGAAAFPGTYFGTAPNGTFVCVHVTSSGNAVAPEARIGKCAAGAFGATTTSASANATACVSRNFAGSFSINNGVATVDTNFTVAFRGENAFATLSAASPCGFSELQLVKF